MDSAEQNQGNRPVKLSTKVIPGKRVTVDGEKIVFVEEGVSGIMLTWRPPYFMLPGGAVDKRVITNG